MGAPSFDFDPTLDELRRRRGNKWRRYGPDVIPAWVADMDFAPSPVIRAALQDALDRGDLGYYGDRLGEVTVGFAQWQRTHHGFDADPDCTLVVDDVIGALRGALDAYTAPGSTAIVPVPVYPPFYSAVAASPARLVTAPMRRGAAGYELDLGLIAELAPDASTLLLCNPHNPTGAVLSRAELEHVAQLAIEHELVVVSDEIWADLVYGPHEHIPIASLGPQIADRTVTLASATKTFNLGGLRCAVAHFGNRALLDRVPAAIRALMGASNALGIDATVAAWREGEPWRQALLAVLAANRAAVDAALAGVDGLRWHSPAGTYLTWIDCTALGLSTSAATHLLEHAAIALSPGEDFEPRASQWCRLNFATSPAILATVLDRLTTALTRTRA